MKQLRNRLCIGLVGLSIFWMLGMVSTNELAKSSILMASALPGITGIFIAIPYFRRRPRWLSTSTLLILLLFFLDATLKGFLRDYFGLRPNPILVLQAIFNSNPGETGEFFQHNWRDVAKAVLVFLAASFLAFLAQRKLAGMEPDATATPLKRRSLAGIGALLTVFLALHFNPTMAKENPLLFWPLRYMDYHEQVVRAENMSRDIERNMAKKSDWKVQYEGPESNTVVWVIGESINRANMSLYGYPRNTTPLLSSMRKDLIVFQDVVSSEPATMASLMKMFTPADIDEPDEWNRKPDVLMLAHEAGFKTFWISNQVPNDGWLGLVSNRASEKLFINKGAGRGENNFDGNLLPGLEAALNNPAPKKLIVVHLLGAHPTYDMRYPQEYAKFDGAVDHISEQLAKADRPVWIRQLRNEYDNAIAYNDYVVGSMLQLTMKATRQNNASLVFSSDHGQEVGHTRNHAGQSISDVTGYEIPMLLWTRSFIGKNPEEKAMLEHRAYQTDHLEHTVLGLLGVRSMYYEASRDILSENFHSQDFVNGLRRINGRPYEPRTVIYQQNPVNPANQ
ncbi:phosphoethanolamine transferase [Herbaspirillum chlorophenolicum]|uniref:phosphoethanolamine transferase n=1 Tax=Herbaspirillum chlorophenolicum TaxID=211589 RepID=UPI00067BD4B2|nr:phosphoethanolamine transferase [Herbaspirillum chlorophenolicum]